MKTVFTNGCFDVLHAGHVALLKDAKALGDWLIVGVNDDAAVEALKGVGRPVQCLEHRMYVLRELRCVDEVRPIHAENMVYALKEIRPHIWVKGGDYTISTLNQAEVQAATMIGVDIRILKVRFDIHASDFIKPVKRPSHRLNR